MELQLATSISTAFFYVRNNLYFCSCLLQVFEYDISMKVSNYIRNECKPFVNDILFQCVVITNMHKTFKIF